MLKVLNPDPFVFGVIVGAVGLILIQIAIITIPAALYHVFASRFLSPGRRAEPGE